MSHDEVSPGGEKSGEDKEESREAPHIPRQSKSSYATPGVELGLACSIRAVEGLVECGH